MQEGITCIINKFSRGRLNQRSRVEHKNTQKLLLQIHKDEVKHVVC